MWKCAKCDRSFRNTNQSHSCRLVSKEGILKKRAPELQAVYNKIIKVVKGFGNFREEAVGSDVIYFKTKSTFMAVKMKKAHVEVEFFLDHKIDHPVISKFLQTSSNRITYVVPVDNAADINKQLVDWMKYSYKLISK
jgi:hypothetical protein